MKFKAGFVIFNPLGNVAGGVRSKMNNTGGIIE